MNHAMLKILVITVSFAAAAAAQNPLFAQVGDPFPDGMGQATGAADFEGDGDVDVFTSGGVFLNANGFFTPGPTMPPGFVGRGGAISTATASSTRCSAGRAGSRAPVGSRCPLPTRLPSARSRSRTSTETARSTSSIHPAAGTPVWHRRFRRAHQHRSDSGRAGWRRDAQARRGRPRCRRRSRLRDLRRRRLTATSRATRAARVSSRRITSSRCRSSARLRLSWLLATSPPPAAPVAFPPFGTLFLDQGSAVIIASGAIPASGRSDLSFFLAPQAIPGFTLSWQALVGSSLSNGFDTVVLP